MTAEHERVHVFHANLALHRDERAHACGIQDASHPEHTVFREAADFECRLGHGIEGIRHHDDDALWRMLNDLFNDGLYYVVVGFQQVVAAHPGLARKARGNHDDVASCRCGIIAVRRGNAGGARIRSRNRTGLHHVQRFAGRRAIQNVRQHYVGQLHIDDALRRGRAHESAAYDGYFFSDHASPYIQLNSLTSAPQRRPSCFQ